jgi:Ca2+-binding RTX toxin-like protein
MKTLFRHLFPRRTSPVRRSPRTAYRPRLTLTALEDRIQPATSAAIDLMGKAGGTQWIQITGTDYADAATVTRQADGSTLVKVTTSAANGPVAVARSFAAAVAPSTVYFYGYGGNDSCDTSQADQRLVAYGGAGNDTITGNLKGADYLAGEDGDDTLTDGGAGGSVLLGGAGNDTYRLKLWSVNAGVTLTDTSGIDTLDLSAIPDNLTVDLTRPSGTYSYGRLKVTLDPSQFENVIGGAGNDIIVGNAKANVLQGGAGDDTISGGAGDDTISGGAGNDSLYGEAGNDTLNGDDGNDTLVGGDGNDTISGGAGNDTLYGDGDSHDGNDWLSGGAGNDTLYGMGGNDWLDGGAGIDTVDGGAGDDVISASPGLDTATGGPGDDLLIRNDYAINFDGGTGNNKAAGLAPGRRTPQELSQVGDLMAVLQDNGDGTQTLTLTGPSGHGFQLVGKWKVAASAAGTETFEADDTVTLKSDAKLPTGPLSIPLPVNPKNPLTVTTTADHWDNAGIVDVFSWKAGPGFGTGGPLSQFKSKFGIDFELPGGSWGLELGTGPTVSKLGLPVNPAVPYFYFSVGDNVSVKVGGVKVIPPPNTMDMKILFDPADPSLVIQGSSSTVVREAGIGVSLKGYIPFTPKVTPTVTPADPIYGNLYLDGGVELKPYPFIFVGQAVVDLDANDDGTPLNVSGDLLGKALTGNVTLADLKTAGLKAFDDIRFGMNGTLKLTFSKSGSLAFRVEAANATVMYTPGLLTFRGEQPDLLKGFGSLEQYLPPGNIRFSLDGSIDHMTSGNSSDWNWHMTATASDVPVCGGFTAKDLTVSVENNGLRMHADVNSLFNLATVEFDGFLWWDGRFNLFGHAALNLGRVAGDAYFHLYIDSSGVKMDATLDGQFDYTDSAEYHGVGVTAGVKGSVSGTLSLTSDSNGTHYKGTLAASGSVILPALTWSIGGSATLTDHGFTVGLDYVPDLSVSW